MESRRLACQYQGIGQRRDNCRDRRERDFDGTCGLRYPKRASTRLARDGESRCKENEMNGSRYYGVRVEGAKFGMGFGSALAITISYSENHSILWAISSMEF